MKTFQVGDKVIVMKAMPEHANWVKSMDAWVGKVGVIRTDSESGTVSVYRKEVDNWWYFPIECLELVTDAPQEFTITEPLQDYERF
jgi:hypothetical protein